MHHLIIFLMVWLIVAPCGISKTIESPDSRRLVFLFAGQSNMDGRADGAQLSERDKKRLAKIADRVQFHYNHKPATPLQLTTPAGHIQRKFNLTQCFGPELFFGIQLAEAYPENEFIFIKRAKGGTSLYGCWNPDWSEEKANLVNETDQPKLYADFIQYVQSVLEKAPPGSYEIAGMLWVQGETDSAVKKWGDKPALTYGQNLGNLVGRTRTDLGVPELPFVLFQVGSGKVVEGMRQTAEMDKNVYLIPQTRDPGSVHFYERNPPPVGHYTAKSMKRIGMEFYRVYERILNGH